jgi:hypothetical protein
MGENETTKGGREKERGGVREREREMGRNAYH